MRKIYILPFVLLLMTSCSKEVKLPSELLVDQNEIREKYEENESEELKELHTLVNEVETMLSLANNNGNIDNAKVQEILIKYDIIDKDLKIQA